VKTFLLLVALAYNWPVGEPQPLRVTVVETREECERLGREIVATAERPRSSQFSCHKGDFELGPRLEGWGAGGRLLERIEPHTP